MIPGSDDIPSLLAWAEDEALKAHNAAAEMPPSKNYSLLLREAFFNELITRIKNMRVNQRPHVEGGRV